METGERIVGMGAHQCRKGRHGAGIPCLEFREGFRILRCRGLGEGRGLGVESRVAAGGKTTECWTPFRASCPIPAPPLPAACSPSVVRSPWSAAAPSLPQCTRRARAADPDVTCMSVRRTFPARPLPTSLPTGLGTSLVLGHQVTLDQARGVWCPRTG